MKQAGTAVKPWYKTARWSPSVIKIALIDFDQLNQTYEDTSTLMKTKNYNTNDIRGKICFH